MVCTLYVITPELRNQEGWGGRGKWYRTELHTQLGVINCSRRTAMKRVSKLKYNVKVKIRNR